MENSSWWDFYGAVLIEISKAFGTLYQELLIAKLSAYGFINESYLTNRWQRVNIKKSFNKWGVLGTLLFNFYLNDYFSGFKEVYNFADDNTFFAGDKDLGSLANILEHDNFITSDLF